MTCRWWSGASGVAATLLAGSVAAAVPDAISYQGVLLDPAGLPVVVPTNLHFRIFRGGDDSAFPSTGVLVYHERTSVVPAAGVFTHMIGTGAAALDCAQGRCILDWPVFSSGDVPLWIEVTIDPDGIVGTGDDDVLLPRTRVGTVGYAYRAASVDGLRWDPVASEMRFDDRTHHALGLTIEPGQDLSFGDRSALTTESDGSTLTVGRGFQSAAFPVFARFESSVEFHSPVTFADEVTLAAQKGLVHRAGIDFPGGQADGSPGSGVNLRSFIHEPLDHSSDAPGSVPGADTELIWAGPYYNANPLNVLDRENPADYSLGFQFTAGWTHLSGNRHAEYMWRHITKGSTIWHPFVWNIADVDTETPLLDYTINTSPGEVGLQVNHYAVAVHAAPLGRGDLEVSAGSGTLYVAGSSGGRIKFEGRAADENQTELIARNPTVDRAIELPDAGGRVHVNPVNEHVGTVMFGDSDDTADTGHEVCRSADLRCVGVRTLDGTDSDCASDQGDQGTLFYAFCRR